MLSCVGLSVLTISDLLNAPERAVDRPLRLFIADIFKGANGGVVVSGRIDSGNIQIGEQVLVMPLNEAASVRCTSP